MLTVCFLWTQCLQEFKIGQRVLLTHFSWQTLSLKVYLWAIHREGQGHKNSSRSPNNCLRNVNVFSIDIFRRSIQIFFTVQVHRCCFLRPLPCSSSHRHSFYHLRSKPSCPYISFILFSHTYPQSTLPTPQIFQPSVSFRLKHQTTRAFEAHWQETGQSTNHRTSERKP